jgi:tRNA1Val (adenine37-N6)-methyltransferase
MKVGTDGVLLGAVTDPACAMNILDVGTGSGLIALMLAQKSDAQITGIDIDFDSVAQAVENGAASPWADRLHFEQAGVQEYALSHANSFDLLVCNPPFFADSLKSPDAGRNLARHNVSLDFDALLSATKSLLRPQGMAWFIYPHADLDKFSKLAQDHGLSLCARLVVAPKSGKPANRCIDSWTKGSCEERPVQFLCIHNSDDTYTEEYCTRCRDYYLFF